MNCIDYFYIDPLILKIGLPIFLVYFIINLETSKGMGNIWWRTNQKGLKELRISNILTFFTQPLHKPWLWYPQLWTLNPYVSGYIYLKLLDILDKNTR